MRVSIDSRLDRPRRKFEHGQRVQNTGHQRRKRRLPRRSHSLHMNSSSLNEQNTSVSKCVTQKKSYENKDQVAKSNIDCFGKYLTSMNTTI